MHEIIYEEATQNGHRNSIKARKLNAWIASQEFASVTTKEFSDSMLKVNFPTYDMLPGYDRLYLYKISYYSDGSPKEGYVSHLSWVPVVGGQLLEISPSTFVRFHPNGLVSQMSKFYGEPTQLFPKGYDLVINGNRFVSSGKGIQSMDFYENGMVKNLDNMDLTSLTIASSVGHLKINFNRVLFNKNGTVKYATLFNPITISSPLSPDKLTLSCLGFDAGASLNLGCHTQPARLRYTGGYIDVQPEAAYELPTSSQFNPSFKTFTDGLVSEAYTKNVITYSQNNQSISLTGRVKFDQSGRIEAGIVTANQFVNLFGFNVPLEEGSDFSIFGDITAEMGMYRFLVPPHDFTCIADDSGGNLSVWPNQKLQWCGLLKGSSVLLFGKQYFSEDSRNDGIGFFSDGNLKTVYLNNQSIEVLIRGQKYIGLDFVELHPNGVARDIHLGEESTFTSQSGSLVTLPKHARARFDENGFLIEQ